MIECIVLSFLLSMRYGLIGCHFDMVAHSKFTLPECCCKLARKSLAFYRGVGFRDCFLLHGGSSILDYSPCVSSPKVQLKVGGEAIYSLFKPLVPEA